jgi:hypothetical protein
MIIPVRSMTLLTLAAAGLMAADAAPAVAPAPAAEAAPAAAPAPVAAAPAVAPAPAAPAATQQPIMSALKDNDLKITIGGQLQARADWSKARTNADLPYDVATGTQEKSDDLDLYMRRVRLYVKGSWQNYTFNLGFRADNADRATNQGTASNAGSRTFEIHNASVTRTFKTGDVSQGIQIGLDYPFFNSASFGNSSAQLTAASRATEQLFAPRGTGIGYRLNAPWVTFGADVQNNNKVLSGTGDTSTVANSASYQAEGLCYTARVELTPTNDWQLKTPDVKEAYAGKKGYGVMWALETGYNQHDTEVETTTPGVGGTWRDTWLIGSEVNLHVNDLSALVEYRWARQTTNSDLGQVSNINADIFLIQAGYALPFAGESVIEPIVRYTNVDLNTSNPTESTDYGSNDYASVSGNQYEIGANWYPKAATYSNKVSLLYQHWVGEDSGAGVGTVTPKADIVRLMYQFLF